MARWVFYQSQERIEGVIVSNMTMKMDAALHEKRFSGRYGIKRLDIFRFIYNVIRQDLGIAEANFVLE
jgi:hypothetical protein